MKVLPAPIIGLLPPDGSAPSGFNDLLALQARPNARLKSAKPSKAILVCCCIRKHPFSGLAGTSRARARRLILLRCLAKRAFVKMRLKRVPARPRPLEPHGPG